MPSRSRSGSRSGSGSPDMSNMVEKEVYQSKSPEEKESAAKRSVSRSPERRRKSRSRSAEPRKKSRSRSRSKSSSRGRSRSRSRDRRRRTRSVSPADVGFRIHLADIGTKYTECIFMRCKLHAHWHDLLLWMLYVRIGTRPDKYTIEKEFGKFGKTLEVWVAENPPCFAFVVYKEKEDAEDAIEEMNGAYVLRILRYFYFLRNCINRFFTNVSERSLGNV